MIDNNNEWNNGLHQSGLWAESEHSCKMVEACGEAAWGTWKIYWLNVTCCGFSIFLCLSVTTHLTAYDVHMTRGLFTLALQCALNANLIQIQEFRTACQSISVQLHVNTNCIIIVTCMPVAHKFLKVVWTWLMHIRCAFNLILPNTYSMNTVNPCHLPGCIRKLSYISFEVPKVWLIIGAEISIMAVLSQNYFVQIAGNISGWDY